MTRWTHGLINRLVVLCDVTMIVLAAALSYSVWHFATWSQVAILCAFGAAVFTQILQLGRAYRVEHYSHSLRQIGHLIVGGVPAALLVAVFYYALVPIHTTNLPGLLAWGGMTGIALILGRLVIVRLGMAQARRHEVLRRQVVLVGDVDRARAFALRCAEEDDESLFVFLGIFDDKPHDPQTADLAHPPVLGGLPDFLKFVQNHRVDVVAIVETWENPLKIGAIVEQLHRIAADVLVELDPDGFNLRFARVTSIAGQPALQVQQRPLKGSLGLLKALEDYSVAVIGLILVSPILLGAALAIKLDSPGPIFFRQPRVGLNNKVFTVFKLRTMTVDPSDDGSLGTTKFNPRITRVGGLLRRLSIDELPQLLNVLKGDMSVVGPRPHVPNMQVAEDVRYEAIREYVARYRMKPGITGWAQINGMRGGINTVEKAERGAKLDLFYIENWSIWFDIRIMLLTITKGMAGRDVF
ncbi:MAG: sugar transferase [Rhizobiales bacterium 24-66-13]|jgi:putative colanic acid biosynthesis UDP-glucose lipid carrier transferase|nr:MAG: sugar transferase [Rhizobiales bacterium 24-66-13]HQS08347.1 exopolysaccharide biosynthesis polyprenyl glycosylphosphotransferase [Xanthobacteraceae bacterium]HQS46966.1 exopolysaccharide biosynthesis polyprenyl glycosylphosphotransferase [Xanthobacteraceae bacterium]